MTSVQGVPPGLPDPTPGWRHVLDLPVLAAAATVAAAVAVLLSTGDRFGPDTGAVLWAALSGPGASAGPAGAVLLVVSLLVGLPHGAVDLLRPEVVAPDAPARRRRAAGAAYLGCALAAALCWVLFPLPTLLGLLLLAAVHFGTADEVTARWRDPLRPRPSRPGRIVRIVAAGGLPVAVPLGLHGDAVRRVLSGLSGGHAASVVACAQVSTALVLAAAAWTVVTAAAAREWASVAETVVLATLFVVATPLLAFAVYFGLWHSWRQVARMVATDSVRDRVRPSTALRRFCRSALLPTAVTVATAALAVLLGGESVLVIGLALVLCLTVPHSIAVARSDRELRRRAGRRGPEPLVAPSRNSPQPAAGNPPERSTPFPSAGPATPTTVSSTVRGRV